MKCSVCNHPEKMAIDQALLKGATFAALSKEYNLSTSALDRHKSHLQTMILKAIDRFQKNLQHHGAFWLSRTLDMVERIAKAAEAEGNYRISLQAIRQGTSLLNIINKRECQFDPLMVYAIITSPQWTQASLLPDDPDIMSLCRRFLAGAFDAPCPESGACTAEFDNPGQSVLWSPSECLSAKTDVQRETAHGQVKWEKSGKSAGKADVKTDKIQINPKVRSNKNLFAASNPNASCINKDYRCGDLTDGGFDLATLSEIGAGRPVPDIIPDFLSAAGTGA
jgi:hypothetical protein